MDGDCCVVHSSQPEAVRVSAVHPEVVRPVAVVGAGVAGEGDVVGQPRREDTYLPVEQQRNH